MLFVESHVHEAFIDEDNVKFKADLTGTAVVLIDSIGIKADLEIASAMVIGTLAALIRSSSAHDATAVGERLWAALQFDS